MAKRTITMIALALAAALLAGCSGAEAQRGQELLQQSSAALKQVRSLRFNARLWVDGTEEKFTVVVDGGAGSEGFYLRGGVDGMPGMGKFQMVSRGGTLAMETDGRWTTTPLPPRAPRAAQLLHGFDFTRYVKSVSVDQGQMLGGESFDKITGVFDVEKMLRDVFARLVPSLGGGVPAEQMDKLSGGFDDVRAVVYIAEATRLPGRVLVDMSFKDGSKKVTMHLALALMRFNEPVEFPAGVPLSASS